MNNGAAKPALQQRNPPPSVATRGSRQPSYEVKLATTDGEQKLVQSNTSGVRTREVAIDFAAKVGLFVAAGANDPSTLGTRLHRSLLIIARRVQEQTKDPATQDATWAFCHLFIMLQEAWQTHYDALKSKLTDERKTWKTEREKIQAALAAEREERQRISNVDWAAEPSINTDDIAAAVSTRIQAALATQLSSISKANTAEAAKIDALHQRMSLLDNTVKTIGSAVEGLLPGKPTYASITASPLSAQNPFTGRTHAEQDAIARSSLQERRVLITANSKRQNAWLDNSPAQHIAKARLGIEAAHRAHTPPSPLDDVKSVIPTHAFRAGKHGVVLSFESKAAADWFSTPAVWSSFTELYEGDVTLRPRHFLIVLRNLPVTHDPSLPSFIPTLCDNNSLPTDWIDNVRWMKPEGRRSASQRSAHLLVAFRSAESANEVLDRGTLSYDGSIYRVERLIRDSPRCAKCQKHGHFAEKCKGEPTCALCAGKGHHSNDCTSKDDPKCATCSTIPDCDANHPSWARECPARLRALERLQRTHPEDFEPRFITPGNAALAFARQLAPLTNITAHRPPPNMSGALKYSKPAEDAPASGNKKKPGNKKQQQLTSRPATPTGSEAGTSKTRSRAPSAASAISSAAPAKANKKPAQRNRRSSSSTQDVEETLLPQTSTA